jgi:hypothetical protein
MTTFHADSEGLTPDDIIKKLLDVVPPPTLDGKRS